MDDPRRVPPSEFHDWILGDGSIETEQPAETLDVERLMRAVSDHCHESADEGVPIFLRHTHLKPFLTADCGSAIAERYARLSREERSRV